MREKQRILVRLLPIQFHVIHTTIHNAISVMQRIHIKFRERANIQYEEGDKNMLVVRHGCCIDHTHFCSMKEITPLQPFPITRPRPVGR